MSQFVVQHKVESLALGFLVPGRSRYDDAKPLPDPTTTGGNVIPFGADASDCLKIK
jgi:hypothetical protein